MVRKEQIDALILGCTELPLILKAKNYAHLKNNKNSRRIDYKVLSRKLITSWITRKFILHSLITELALKIVCWPFELNINEKIVLAENMY